MTKMGVYIALEMIPLEVGTKIKKNQVIAGTKNFDKNGIYCSGKNIFMAVMQYNGFGHEDSYVVNEKIANEMSRDIVKEIQIVIPPETKVIKLEKEIGKKIEKDEVLVEFTYQDDLDDYLDINQLNQIEDDSENTELLSSFEKQKDTIKL